MPFTWGIVALCITLTGLALITVLIASLPYHSSNIKAHKSQQLHKRSSIPTLKPRSTISTTNLNAASMPGPSNAFAVSQSPMRLDVLANFADPSLHYEAGTKTWYAYATNSGAGIAPSPGTTPDVVDLSIFNPFNIQIATSTDGGETWKLHDTDALPDPGSWAKIGTGSIVPTPGASGSPGTPAPMAAKFSNGTLATLLMPAAVVWSPDVFKRHTEGKFVMYYAASSKADGSHCISAAVASTLLGPFTPAGSEALICNAAVGGVIDPAIFVDGVPKSKTTVRKERARKAKARRLVAPFVAAPTATDTATATSTNPPTTATGTPPTDDDNAIYLAYKEDGNSLGHGGECSNMVAPIHSTPIMLQRLSADGLSLYPNSPATQLLDRVAQDGPLVEAPQLVHAAGMYYLFYNSGCTRSDDYAVRYATSSSITGPYVRAGGDEGAPLLQTGDFGLVAPGSVAARFVPTDGLSDSDSFPREGMEGKWTVALHGRVGTAWGGVRPMFSAGLVFEGGSVRIVA